MRIENSVLLCANGFFAYIATLFVYVLFPELRPCALDSESYLSLLGFNATRREWFVLAFLDLRTCSLNVDLVGFFFRIRHT